MAQRNFTLFILAVLYYAISVAADVPLYYDAVAYDKLVEDSDGCPTQTFHSSDVVAPIFQVNTWEKDETDPGYIFLGFVYPDHSGGPMIFDGRDLSLVYADQSFRSSFFSNAQTFNGERYLTLWEGENTRHHADGYALMYNENYDLVYNISAGGMENASQCYADFHEMQVTMDNTILVTVYFRVQDRDLTSIGGAENSAMLDSGFQEIDPVTNEVLFRWAASDHFSVDYTYASNDNNQEGLDFAHTNSVEKTEDGNYLVSSRHMGLLTLINGKTGKPIWVLGGRHNQFKDLSDGMATNFGWQHDARFYKNQSHITLFDNHDRGTGFCSEEEGSDNPCFTRILHLEIDTDAMTARVVRSFHHPQHINAEAMGGVQVTENGNYITAWGYNPGIVEYKSDGTVVMDIQRARIGLHKINVSAYRVHKGAWKGMPKHAPSIALTPPTDVTNQAMVYLSWNGATEVAKWVVYGNDKPFADADPKNIIAESLRTGFETGISVSGSKSRYIIAAAVDSSGNILGSTHAMDMQTYQVAKTHPSDNASNGPAHTGNNQLSQTGYSKYLAEAQALQALKGDNGQENKTPEASHPTARPTSASSSESRIGVEACLFGGSVILFIASCMMTLYACWLRRKRPDLRETVYSKISQADLDESV